MNVGKFELVKSSGPLEYEWLTIEILDEGEPVIAIDCEKGIGLIEAEVFGIYQGYGTGKKVPLDDLIESLIQARSWMTEIHTPK